MSDFEVREEFAGAEEPDQRPTPVHVKILVGMVFVPVLLLFVIWGLLAELILTLVPQEAQRAAERVLYYSGLACVMVVGCGLFILIGGYFRNLVHNATENTS